MAGVTDERGLSTPYTRYKSINSKAIAWHFPGLSESVGGHNYYSSRVTEKPAHLLRPHMFSSTPLAIKQQR